VQAELLEHKTGVKVLRHDQKKPQCNSDILDYYLKQHPELEITSPSQIAVVGDRLFTDVIMANMMGARAFYLSEGVVGKSTVGLGFLLSLSLSRSPALGSCLFGLFLHFVL
jgi:phosphatidylglycerophosphatase GEP4